MNKGKEVKMKKIILPTVFVGSILAIALAAGCTSVTESNENKALNQEATNGTKSVDKAYRLDLKTEPTDINVNVPAALIFTVRDASGALIKDLQIVHEKPMHLLIVSTDLAEFYHVHPEPLPDGSFRVEHTFPNGGEYKLYADFTPHNSPQVVENLSVNVSGNPGPKVPLVVDSKFEKSVDGLKVTMKPSAAIVAGQELTLDFTAFDAASGKPALDLENYLGELAHFVIISEDLVDFVHAHPMSKGESMDEMKMESKEESEHNSDGHSHGAESKTAKKQLEHEVSAHTTFPRAGIYKLWAQFQRRGRVISVPFVVNVAAGNTKPIKSAAIPVGATQITVSSSGYEPASIPVKKGQPIKLAFYRADADNCGGEVVFPKLNIRKKLAVGETILVEFTPAEVGEIAFTCGMDMLSGKIVVSES